MAKDLPLAALGEIGSMKRGNSSTVAAGYLIRETIEI